MDPREFYHRAERLHDDPDCANCPPALKLRCTNLPGDETHDDLCTLIVYAKLDMEDDIYTETNPGPEPHLDSISEPVETEKILDEKG